MKRRYNITMPSSSVQKALAELDRYAKMNVRHSKDQYAKHGTLHSVAQRAFHSASSDANDLWRKPWVPWDFDIGDSYSHPVYQSFSEEQQLAWNHLEWAYNYEVVAAGERQIIVLNNHAVRQYKDVLPSVVELETRESFEEVDHVDAFQMGIQAVYDRYLPNRKREKSFLSSMSSMSPSGFRHQQFNKITRHLTGVMANRLLGKNFPTLFFLIRTIKTVSFKGMENSIAKFDEAPKELQQLSHLHRLDESRHQATALKLSKLSNEVLEQSSWESKRLFKLAIHSAWPNNRLLESRMGFWKRVLFNSEIFADISIEHKQSFFTHICRSAGQSLRSLHPRQIQITQQVTKRAVTESGLSPEFKQLFVDVLRKDPIHSSLVEAVVL